MGSTKRERKEKKRKRFRVCEVISWDLSPYTLAGAGGECDRGKILKSRGLPTLKEVFIYGKGMNLLPNSDLPPPVDLNTLAALPVPSAPAPDPALPAPAAADAAAAAAPIQYLAR